MHSVSRRNVPLVDVAGLLRTQENREDRRYYPLPKVWRCRGWVEERVGMVTDSAFHEIEVTDNYFSAANISAGLHGCDVCFYQWLWNAVQKNKNEDNRKIFLKFDKFSEPLWSLEFYCAFKWANCQAIHNRACSVNSLFLLAQSVVFWHIDY